MICALVLYFAGAAAQQQPLAVPHFERGDSIVVSGVEIFDRIIYLPARVNGAGPFTFAFDTGAGSISAIDQTVADSLGMKSSFIAKGGGAGEDAVDIKRVDSVAVSLAGLSFEPRTLIAIPLRRMDPQWGKRKDGLIGGDLLSTLITSINYENRTLVLHNAASYEYKGPGERIPVQIFDNFLFVSAQVLLYGKESAIDALLMLDTGVRITTFNTPYSRANELPAQSPLTATGVTGYGIGGVSRGIVGRVRGLRIGSILIENPVVDFSTDEAGALADTSFSGIIGADILSRFNVVIDYSRSQIVLEKNKLFGTPSEFDMSGIRFVMEGERFDVFKVFSVFDGSPAAEAGIQPGDFVKTIDGRAAASFTRESLRSYMEREGAEVRLAITRGTELKNISLRLRRLA
jgi:hypothetical protein